MRLLISGVLAALMMAAAAQASPKAAPVITYTIAPRLSGPDLAALEITVRFKADADGVTRLELPDQAMGRKGAWRNLSNLTVEGADSMVEDGPAHRLVRSRPGRRLILRYTLSGVLNREPSQSDSYPAEPWIASSWFYVDGPSAMVAVEGRDDVPVSVAWDDAWPKDFHLASNLEGGALTDPRAAVLIGGRDLRIVRAGPLRLAVRGNFAFADADLARSLETILRAERGFFGDAQQTPYLVTAQSLKTENGSTFSGTGKHQAFAMAVTPNLSLDEVRVLLAHEIFHTWNPSRLGKPVGPPGYWYSEGFTDFYAHRLMAREGQITPQAFVAAWNETLRAYGTSPAIAMPGEEAAAKFWTDPNADQLAYQRGALLAAIWDQRLRAAGASLDAVLDAQMALHERQPDLTIAKALLEAAKSQGLEVRADIEAHIDQGRPIRLPTDAFLPCATVTDVTTPVFDRGFEPKVDDKGTMTVADLREDSAAYRAGLRNGAVIVQRRKGGGGDATTPYELVVRDGDGPVRTLTFLPQGATTQRYQQLVLTPEAAAAPTLCAFRPNPSPPSL
ncbi:hypothetical protein SGCZBJ_19810 [Caulobacter zeae]|uniref:Peptidase M61 catalytic domain-containing protein n=1 Tax=Caulobacter zeae TaxID=2055137 RepID=A0A2N5D6Y7_9CAUL|nr:hypothetical protein [Caulobacter zeae]PLR21825.1 hypothetical protein SGCZBJ_19810 [Caulobacter zeae]